MRFLRDPDPDLWANPEPEFRDDRLRELVDTLPRKQAHMVSRVYFGGASLEVASTEIRVTPVQGKRILERALEGLRNALSEED